MEKAVSAYNFIAIDFHNAAGLDYQAAIQLGVNQLVANQAATPALFNAIMASMAKYGPYFVLSPKLALAHAAPGPYCLKPALALIVFDQPISFSKEAKHDVQVLVTLAAHNHHDHIGLLGWFANRFANPELVTKLTQAQNLAMVKTILEQ